MKNIIDQGEKDVIDFRYIVDCVDAGRKLPYRRYYFLNLSPTTAQQLKGVVDLFGDSFTDDIDEKTLLAIFHNVENMIDMIEKKKTPKVSLLKKRKAAPVIEPVAPEEDELLAVDDWKAIKASQ